MSAALLAIAVLPLVAVLAVTLPGDPLGERTGRLATIAAGIAFALSAALALQVAFGGPVSAVVEASDGGALLGLHADRVAAVLLLLVCGVSAVVQAFARRYLRGDVRAGRFFAATGVLTAASVAMVAAATLIGLAVAWTVAGLALCALLGMYGDLPAAREGVRRTARALVVGDGALWIGVAVAVATWGNLDLRRLGEVAPQLGAEPAAVSVVACLLVVAAIARSAQLPLQGWLPATLAAPTPVSALLHAGVVNAGGVLLVKLSPIFGASAAATHLAFAAGAATLVFATVVMLVKPDVKGALAHSTMGQMGFMVMTCGLGAYAAAIFHLVAHGMYKAALFLGSGSAVRRHVRHAGRPAVAPPGRSGAVAAAVLAVAVPAAALAAAVTVAGSAFDANKGSAALLLFAWASAAWMGAGWLRRRHSPAAVAGVVTAVAVACFGYVALLGATAEFLAPATGAAGDASASAWLLAPVVAVLLALTVLRLSPWDATAGLHRTLYALALGAGQVGGRSPRRARSRPLAIPGALVPRSAGGRL